MISNQKNQSMIKKTSTINKSAPQNREIKFGSSDIAESTKYNNLSSLYSFSFSINISPLSINKIASKMALDYLNRIMPEKGSESISIKTPGIIESGDLSDNSGKKII